jgi:hypothetical protein
MTAPDHMFKTTLKHLHFREHPHMHIWAFA